MICKQCGKELPDEAKFCSVCGTAQEVATTTETTVQEETSTQDTEPEQPQPQIATAENNATSEKITDTLHAASKNLEKTNPLCIAGLVLTILLFFFDYYGIISYTALILSFFGYRQAKEKKQKGTMLAIVCMAVAGIFSLIAIVHIIEYAQYQADQRRMASGILNWLGY